MEFSVWGKVKVVRTTNRCHLFFFWDESAFSNYTSPLILSKWRNKPSDSDGCWTITLQFRVPADGQQPLCPEHLGLLRATTRSGDIAGLA